MQLDGTFADRQVDGDDLVGLAGRHQRHAFGKLGLVRRLPAGFGISNDGRLDQIQQPLGVEGLFDEVHGAAFERSHRGGYVTEAGEDDDRFPLNLFQHQPFQQRHRPISVPLFRQRNVPTGIWRFRNGARVHTADRIDPETRTRRIPGRIRTVNQ